MVYGIRIHEDSEGFSILYMYKDTKCFSIWYMV